LIELYLVKRLLQLFDRQEHPLVMGNAIAAVEAAIGGPSVGIRHGNRSPELRFGV
jgi:hypothetical protein